MKKGRAWLKSIAFSIGLMCGAILQAATVGEGGEDARDLNALKDWVNQNRQVGLKDLGGVLSLSGEVRTEYQCRSIKWLESTPDWFQPNNTPNNFDIEFNLMLDYFFDNIWASVKVEFDNNAGIFEAPTPSENNRVSSSPVFLERAKFGGYLWQGEQASLAADIGRMGLGSLINSRVECASTFDGIWLRFNYDTLAAGDYYLHGGSCLVNESLPQFAYMGEAGVRRFLGSGAFLKVSAIDWDTHTGGEPYQKAPFRFLVLQGSTGYDFLLATKPAQIYGAVLYNPLARPNQITNDQLANWGGYVGFSFGSLRQKGDFAFDANYQIVQAQCVPNFDLSGIGLGSGSRPFYPQQAWEIQNDKEIRGAIGGNVNYQGVQLTAEYLLHDHLDIQQSFQIAQTLDHNIGYPRRAMMYEIEFIFSW